MNRKFKKLKSGHSEYHKASSVSKFHIFCNQNGVFSPGKQTKIWLINYFHFSIYCYSSYRVMVDRTLPLLFLAFLLLSLTGPPYSVRQQCLSLPVAPRLELNLVQETIIGHSDAIQVSLNWCFLLYFFLQSLPSHFFLSPNK